MDSELVELGVITRPHGLRGELCVNYYGEDIALLRKQIWLKNAVEKLTQVKITNAKYNNNQVIIKLENINDRTAAESFRGLVLFIKVDDLPELDDEAYYVHALLDSEIINIQDNSFVGILRKVEFLPAQELWSIESSLGEEILFPAVPEFVDKIDVDTGKIFINPPEGLLELNKTPSK